MTATPQPPPEAALIRARREAPPHMSMRHAARLTGISESRWRQLEAGGKPYRGRWEPEIAPADTLARMAQAAGVTAGQLEQAGRADAAGELRALRPAAAEPDYAGLLGQYRDLAEQQAAQLARFEEKFDRFISQREHRGEQEDSHEDDQGNGSRRAG